jgi:hypothetical protein
MRATTPLEPIKSTRTPVIFQTGFAKGAAVAGEDTCRDRVMSDGVAFGEWRAAVI